LHGLPTSDMLQSSRMKEVFKIVAALTVVALIAAGVLYQRTEKKRTVALAHLQAQFEAWDSEVAQMQHDLPVGTSRVEVKKYLEAHKIQYSDGPHLLINLGDVPGDGLVCGRWSGAISLEFRPIIARESNEAKLQNISLKKYGRCL
jgi:hypothetical protein